MKSSQQAYAFATQTTGAGHNHRPPHLHHAVTLIKGLAAEEEVPAGTEQILSAEAQAMEATEQEEVNWYFRECRLTRMFKSETKKLWLSVQKPELRQALHLAIKSCGGRLLLGKAPAGHTEWQLARWLDQLGK